MIYWGGTQEIWLGYRFTWDSRSLDFYTSPAGEDSKKAIDTQATGWL